MSLKCYDYRVKMCKVEMLRALLNQRLNAAVEEVFVVFERTIAEYEEELCRTKEENERQRQLLDAVFKKPRHVPGLLVLYSHVSKQFEKHHIKLSVHSPEKHRTVLRKTLVQLLQ